MSDSDEESDYANIFYWNQYLQEDGSRPIRHSYEAIPTSSDQSELEPLLDISDDEQDSDDNDSYDLENLFYEEEKVPFVSAHGSPTKASPPRSHSPTTPGTGTLKLSTYESEGARPKIRPISTPMTSHSGTEISPPADKNLEALRIVSQSPFSPTQLPSQSPITTKPSSWLTTPPFKPPSQQTVPGMIGRGSSPPPRGSLDPDRTLDPVKGAQLFDSLYQQLLQRPSTGVPSVRPTQTKISPSHTLKTTIPPAKRISPSKKERPDKKSKKSPSSSESSGSSSVSSISSSEYQTKPRHKPLLEDELAKLKEMGYDWVRDLDTGTAGQVYLIWCSKDVKVMVPCKDSEGEEYSSDRNSYVKTKNLKGQHVALKRLMYEQEFEDELDDSYYIVMEYLNGRLSLSNYLIEIRFSETVTLDDWTIGLILKHVSYAVQYLHSHGICHYDMHNGNIMPHINNKQMVWKIIDFGLSSFEGGSSFKPDKDLEDFRDELLAEILACKGIKPSTRQIMERVISQKKILNTIEKIVEHLRSLFPESDDPPEGSAAEKFVKKFEE